MMRNKLLVGLVIGAVITYIYLTKFSGGAGGGRRKGAGAPGRGRAGAGAPNL